ncbi:MAG TPA: helix-turn-helix transcriptional regulator [Vicinamibacteria bacterium]|nr:helix-turn-helix transcriptional regulator [Vicinamibacteria bacterium]
MRLTSVPLHASDLVRRREANGFAVTEAWSPPRRIPAHAHHQLSLTILLEGAFAEQYAAIHAPQECARGSLLVRPPGEVHANDLGRQGGRTLSIEMDAARVEPYGTTLAPRSLEHRREPAFLDLGLAMSRELAQNDASSGLVLESLVLELLARRARLGDPERDGALPAWLKTARDSIHDRFEDPALRLSDLATEVAVHPVSLTRAFRRHLGSTPGEYVRRLRLEQAHDRVRRSTESIASIALACGFADQSHLTRAFRRRYGVPPGQLRRRVR